MAGILFCTFYILVFTYIIFKAPLFKLERLNNVYPLGAFYLKLLCGIVLWYIYTYHYKNRYTSDIFKYYDDGKLMFSTLHSSPSAFFKMLFGIGDSGPEISSYYHQMKSWINDHDSALYNNSHFIVRLNAIFMFLSWGHYGVHVIFMCFAALCGFCFLYKFFYPYLTDRPKALFAALFLFPSVLLWTSGVLKESLLVLGLGMSLYHFGQLITKKGSNVKNTLWILLAIVLMFEARAYVVIFLIPCIVAEILVRKTALGSKHSLLTYMTISLLYILGGLNINYIFPKYNPLQMLADKQKDMNRVLRGGIFLLEGKDSLNYTRINAEDSDKIVPANFYADSILHHGGLPYITSSSFCYHEQVTGRIASFKLKQGTPFELIRLAKRDTLHLIATDTGIYRIDIYGEPAKSKVDINPITPTLGSLLTHIPQAFIIAAIRPFPNEIHSAAVAIYFIENIVLFVLVLFSLIVLKKRSQHTNIILFCSTYCILILTLIGLTTPVYGGIERYKSVVIPFMLILLLLISDKEKINAFLRKNK